ncbi:hypothetical protein EIN_468490 [Entamoeba invadens IP1]|uniref:VHS domain-containing protein n=1 Tax=Entamoeba invadens IP1 TaxID=370355 RepID=A0A0A1TUI8_ENTIV|nr:hypothetical protein EIN_468490 [Entamoeba invadens IP1]ELP83705.1 hypothetical protein EIN_468490 [Entamoeba invadens IP1]|eukprot:XP_004183051.1 hypothetical protein EIN_468490 [Entamoeba invadens IP1]
MAKKQSMPLSQLFDITVNESNKEINKKNIASIVKVAASVSNAPAVIRVLIVNKMKAYCTGFIPIKEMFYTLSLAGDLFDNAAPFQAQVCHKEFTAMFELSTNIGKIRKSTPPDMVQEKALSLLLNWGSVHGSSCPEYKSMYEKYEKKGFFKILEKEGVTDDEKNALEKMSIADLASEITKIGKEIQVALTKEPSTTNTNNAKVLHKKASALKSTFEDTFAKYQQTPHTPEEVEKYKKLNSEFGTYVSQIEIISKTSNSKKRNSLTLTTDKKDKKGLKIKVTGDKADKKEKKHHGLFGRKKPKKGDVDDDSEEEEQCQSVL